MYDHALDLSIAGVALVVPRVRGSCLLNEQEGCCRLSFLRYHRDSSSRGVVADDLLKNKRTVT